jgi:UDP-N-acetylglucosamine 1-carboxyvinyltransferase
LFIAGLNAEGITEVDNIYQIERGYEDIEQKFNSLGAHVTRSV